MSKKAASENCFWGHVKIRCPKAGRRRSYSGNTGHYHSFATHRAFWPWLNIPVAHSALLCHISWRSLAQGQFVFTVLTIVRAFPFYPHRPDLPFLSPSPWSNTIRCRKNLVVVLLLITQFAMRILPVHPANMASLQDRRLVFGRWSHKAWHFLLPLLCPSPSLALLWARTINIKEHEWNKDGDCLLVPGECLQQHGLLSFI